MTARPVNVLVAGGGVAALEAALALRDLAHGRVNVELLAPEPEFWYRPLSVVEPFGIGNLHGLDLGTLAEACGATLTLGTLASVDHRAHVAHTAAGAALDYDALLVATGARPETAVPGALTFRGPADSALLAALLHQLEQGSIRQLAFALPGGTAWPLPLYELALLTAGWVAAHGVENVELTLVTPEEEPLGLFGHVASAAVRELLGANRIDLRVRRYPIAVENGELSLAPVGAVPVDRVIALPQLRGEPIAGIPCDSSGFIPTRPDGTVRGVHDVYAAGDITSFPVKQGGLAAQQARAAAETIASRAGADLIPAPFQPVLRGLLLTGGTPAYLRAELIGSGKASASVAEAQPLWWPPGKIGGRHLAPFLAEYAGLVLTPPEGAEGLPVEANLAVP